MKRSAVLFSLFCMVLAGGPAAGDTAARQAWQLIFQGFSQDESRGIAEYIVEFPGDAERGLDRTTPPHREYRYLSENTANEVEANLRRMLVYLDIEAEIGISANVIVIRHAALPPSPPRVKPVVLNLTTARGRRPVYTIGEKLDLIVELNQDAWLYCFTRDSDGKVFKLFPNSHHEDAWLAGGRVHRIPGEIFPFELDITEPAGSELLSCYASDRDLRTDLPPALGSPDIAALPPDNASRLDDIFGALKNANVSNGRLPIMVKR